MGAAVPTSFVGTSAVPTNWLEQTTISNLAVGWALNIFLDTFCQYIGLSKKCRKMVKQAGAELGQAQPGLGL